MLKVLVLDDDADNCQTLEHIIRFAGHQVNSVYDSNSFLSRVESWRPQVVIVDLLLGDTDGITVLTELAPSANKPDVIVVSGAHRRLLEAASRSASSHGFRVLGTLAKPFTPDALRQLLTKQWQVPQVVTSKPRSFTPAISLADLDNAFAQQRFYLMYQPKIDCKTSSLVGFEALCRLHLPVLGEVSPEQFIPLCEQHGLIGRLTQFVINTAVPWFADFVSNAAMKSQHLNTKDLKLAINISALSIEQSDIFSYLIAQCAQCNVPAGAIILELTETAAMADPVASLDILTRLRLYGFQLSIDDFGTGFSSILQLVRLPFSELKIDKHFVSTAAESKESRLVISSVIDMAHALGLSVTAEGIEDRQTLAFLQRKHCDSAQGFYFSRPLAIEQIEHWVTNHQDDRELARLKALRALDILDSAPEERFDRIIRLAQRIFEVPICAMSLIDKHRIWYKSKVGMALDEIERKGALCELAIQQSGSYLVPDTLLDTQTKSNNMVIGKPFVRFYAGHRVKAPNGVVIGSLCLLHFKPKLVNSGDDKALRDLAAMLEEELASSSKMTLDVLTQVKNRSGFDNRASSLITLCKNHHLTLQIVSIKINFNSPEQADIFNVFHDRAIRETAKIIKKSFAGADLMARIDDNSFIIMYVAQEETLVQLALHAFNSLVTAEKAKKQPNIPLTYSASRLDCKGSELSSLQQLYLALDMATHSAQKQAELNQN